MLIRMQLLFIYLDFIVYYIGCRYISITFPINFTSNIYSQSRCGRRLQETWHRYAYIKYNLFVQKSVLLNLHYTDGRLIKSLF